MFKKKKSVIRKRTMGEMIVALAMDLLGSHHSPLVSRWSFEGFSKRMKELVKEEEQDKVERLLSSLGYCCEVPEPDRQDEALQHNARDLALNEDFKENLCRIVETGSL